MSVFDFEKSNNSHFSANSKKSKKSKKFALGIGFLAVAIGLSSTLAANININSGPVEFGQGISQTVACGGSNPSLTITPQSTFFNESGAGSFRMTSITVSNIPEGCNGVDFTIKALPESNAENPDRPFTLYGAFYNESIAAQVGYGTQLVIHYDGSDTPFAASTVGSYAYYDVSDATGNSSEINGSFTVQIGADCYGSDAPDVNFPVPDATEIYKILIETGETAPVAPPVLLSSDTSLSTLTVNGQSTTVGSTLTVDYATSLALVATPNDSGAVVSGISGTGSITPGDTRTITFTVTAADGTTSTEHLYVTVNSELSCAQGGTCIVGDVGPGGGKVFYVDSAAEYAGWTYLEAAPAAIDTPIFCTLKDGHTDTFAMLIAIGDGATNTQNLIDNCSAGVGPASDAYVSPNSTADWFAPSLDELELMYPLRATIGGFTQLNYWSSSDYDVSSTAYQCWYGTPPGSTLVCSPEVRTWGFKTRPIRAFG